MAVGINKTDAEASALRGATMKMCLSSPFHQFLYYLCLHLFGLMSLYYVIEFSGRGYDVDECRVSYGGEGTEGLGRSGRKIMVMS